MVLPVPGWPSIRCTRCEAYPPSRMPSKPAIPVEIACVLALFSGMFICLPIVPIIEHHIEESQNLPASISYEFLLPSQAAAPARAETAISYRS
ncbi:hypothetical protein ES703_25934 [subsurface metagenome]